MNINYFSDLVRKIVDVITGRYVDNLIVKARHNGVIEGLNIGLEIVNSYMPTVSVLPFLIAKQIENKMSEISKYQINISKDELIDLTD